MNLNKHKLNITIIILFFILTEESFSHGLDNFFLFGLKGEYFNQDSYNGMNLNLSVIPKEDIKSGNVLIDDFFVLGVNVNQYDRKIRTNFTLCNMRGLYTDSLAGFVNSGEVGILSFKHNIQIKSDISWLKICPGFGYGKRLENNSAVFLGINGGLGISSAYLGDNVKGFSSKDFDGVSVLGSPLFFYQIDYLKIIIKNDFKSIIWTDKILYSNTPSLELTFNITKFFNRNYHSGHLLILRAGDLNSSLYYESERNQSMVYDLNLFLHQ